MAESSKEKVLNPRFRKPNLEVVSLDSNFSTVCTNFLSILVSVNQFPTFSSLFLPLVFRDASKAEAPSRRFLLVAARSTSPLFLLPQKTRENTDAVRGISNFFSAFERPLAVRFFLSLSLSLTHTLLHEHSLSRYQSSPIIATSLLLLRFFSSSSSSSISFNNSRY